MRRSGFWLASLMAVLVLPWVWVGCEASTMTLATTTSTYDTGLLDVLIPPFEKTQGVKVKVVAVGTGQALALGRNGDADVLLVHDRAGEDKFVAEGHGVNRRDVMYNDFIILGPPGDPARIKGMKEAAPALARIAQARAAFASRGDGSGTHAKDKALWAQAGLNPGPSDPSTSSGQRPWYLSLGQGMGETLTLANEKQAYTLSDRGTYLAQRAKLGLDIMVEGDKQLFNPYGVIAVNPAQHPQAKYSLALKFIDYITAYETQQAIGQYRKNGLGPLFYPDSEAWKARNK